MRAENVAVGKISHTVHEGHAIGFTFVRKNPQIVGCEGIGKSVVGVEKLEATGINFVFDLSFGKASVVEPILPENSAVKSAGAISVVEKPPTKGVCGIGIDGVNVAVTTTPRPKQDSTDVFVGRGGSEQKGKAAMAKEEGNPIGGSVNGCGIFLTRQKAAHAGRDRRKVAVSVYVERVCVDVANLDVVCYKVETQVVIVGVAVAGQYFTHLFDGGLVSDWKAGIESFFDGGFNGTAAFVTTKRHTPRFFVVKFESNHFVRQTKETEDVGRNTHGGTPPLR